MEGEGRNIKGEEGLNAKVEVIRSTSHGPRSNLQPLHFTLLAPAAEGKNK